tara:strand:- start:498 stop:1841 length:1344 start_codon:yes stop_codon:yes gene_type:complete
MNLSLKKKIYFFLIFFFIIIIFFISLNLVVKSFYLRNLTTLDQKIFIKNFLLPWKGKEDRVNKNFYLEKLNNEINFKKSLKKIKFKEKLSIELENNLKLEKYTYLSGFETGIDNSFPGSGYIDFYENNFIALSSRGILGFGHLENSRFSLKQIENNIDKFIERSQFEKHKRFSIKDLKIHNNKIFVSYTDEIKDNCWNISVIYSEFNFSKINFKKLFSPKECIHSEKNIDNEFNAMQSGGRIVAIDKEHIVLSIGEFRSRYLAQNIESVNGKLIKINVNNSNFEIISIGHRNVQGLLYDEDENFLIFTEHGPAGGDEINLLDLSNLNSNNFGWPFASYGYHYSDKLDISRKNKYPFLKSHSIYGFVEPIKYFTPSIGISELTKIGKKAYIFSCLSCKSIFFFDLDDNYKFKNLLKIKINERVRDLFFKNGKLYLFLEDTASIGIIEL